MNPEILFEDNHLLIINKKAGELAQGDETGDIPLIDSLKTYIKNRDNKPGNVFLGLVHRLDRPTSGVLIFAKTSESKEISEANADRIGDISWANFWCSSFASAENKLK